MLTLSRGECDRLDNGNTLISAGRTGNVLEVNNDNEIVWHLNVKENNVVPVTIYRSERIKNLYPNVFSFKINNLFGSYNDNYQIELNQDSLNFDIYNQGWVGQDFIYELLDQNQNILTTNNVFINAFNNQSVNIAFNSSIENYILKIHPSNDINSYQLLQFDNNFIIGDINDDLVLNIQDIIIEKNYFSIKLINQYYHILEQVFLHFFLQMNHLI